MNGVSHAAGGAESNEKTDGGKEQPFTTGILKVPQIKLAQPPAQREQCQQP